MDPRQLAGPAADIAREIVSGEVDYWRSEISRPWRTGRPGHWAEVGRWIGTGLAVGAAVWGVMAAVQAERLRD
ncbi:hypothetical protein [Candidatus Palauibacter sp.]|uniref:hypothetical protein n=1 Tax=Candidatus Palauibacter sp. TaxID=3101350 RepID=UPI003B52B483